MDIFRKNYIDDLISIKSLISVWRIVMGGMGGTPSPDIHDFWELMYVEEGTYPIVVDGELFEIGCGECFLYPPLAQHIAAHLDNAVVLRIISFESDSSELFKIARSPKKLSGRARELFLGANEIGLNSFFYPGSDDGIRGMKLSDGADRYDIQRMKKSLELCLVEMLSSSERGGAASKNSGNYKKERYAALNEYLRMNIGKNLSLADMAEALSVSVSALKSISKEAFGLSPLTYFITLKLEAAKRMIRESSMNFTEISARLGFGSVHYFSRLFTSRVGMTPTEYAKSVEF